jgi:drug/metabolite transporter (DMT)-like permease
LNVRSKYVLIALLCALIVAFEAVAIEGALNIENLNVLLVSAMPSLMGGIILMSIYPRGTAGFTRSLSRRGWISMVTMCAFVAAGVILWFDAVSRIGAGKEAILGGGSSEVLFVVVLSAIFLSERLDKLEAIGSALVVLGVFIVLMNMNEFRLSFGFGEAEAILSSLCLGISVVMTTALLRDHDLTPLSGLELFLSGSIVMLFGMSTGLISFPGVRGWVILVLLGLFPAMGLLTYNAGLPKIGASLVSVLFALNGIMTVCVQMAILLIFPDADIKLPQSVLLAMLGGAVAFVGVYLLNKKELPAVMGRSQDGSST